MAGSVADNASSHGGSRQGSAAGSSLIQVASSGRDDTDASATSTFWNDCFGAFYTVNRDRSSSLVFVVFKYVMEFAQLVFLLLGARYGWRFHTGSKAWDFVEFIQVMPFMTVIGHSWYAAVFVVFVVLLVACLGVYAWAFYCFQNNKFDYMWPLRLVRLFSALFFDALDVMSMLLMTTALDCHYYGWPAATRMHSNEFPMLNCTAMPSVAYGVLAVLGIILFVVLGAFNRLARMDLDPTTRVLDAYAHPAVELWCLAAKVLMVLASVFLGDFRHLAIFWFLCSLTLCYIFWKAEPMVYSWVNYIRMGTFASVFYTSCLFMALQFPPSSIWVEKKVNPNASVYVDYVASIEIGLIGILPAFAAGGLASFLRLRYFSVTILNRFKLAPPGAKARDIHRFSTSREAEIVARCCRVWVDCDSVEPEAAALAERVLKSGLTCLPNSPFMIICYVSHLVDIQGSYQSGFMQLQMALKLGPSFIDRYAIFSREQDHTHKSAGCGNGQNDMRTDVEFQKSLRLVMRAHREALRALRTFWQLLTHVSVCFEDLTLATRRIDKATKAADKMYRMVLQRHAEEPRLLRLYARFLERVKHDPWAASQWTMEAEKLEQAEGESRHVNMLGLDDDGGSIGKGHISLFSIAKDGQERALCVFNSQGVMTMTNEAMRDMFGYGKGEIKGKTVASLLPPTFADQLMHHLKNFVVSGDGSVVVRTSEVVGLHADRHMFGARITIVRILGIGEDSTFLAALEAVPIMEDTATVWLLANGQVLSVDSQFCDWFGYSATDLEGGSAAAWTPSTKQLDDVLKAARHSIVLSSQAEMAAAAQDAADKEGEPCARFMAPSAFGSHMDAIADALEAAAAPAAAANSGVCCKWTLKAVRVVHKFAGPFTVDIKVANTNSSTFCMHVLSVRRTGAAAIKTMPHMLVTSPSGPVVHVTEALASLLGTSPKVLMANGSATAMEALMVQPFGLMHRAGLSGSMPSQQPPSYSCRSGLSILMPVLGCPLPEALPFRMQMKKRVNLDETFHVCTLEATTWDQALDERSLRLSVDKQGMVMAVSYSTPASLFGFSASTLVGRSVSCCVMALHGSGLEDTSAASLLGLSSRSHAAQGLSWRVGVGLARQEDDLDAAALTGTLSGAPVFTTKIVAAVLTVISAPSLGPPVLDSVVEITDQVRAPQVAGHGGYELRLWRADMITSVVEVDSNGLVVESEHFLEKLYPAAATLGMSMLHMLGHHISNFLPLGEHKVEDLYDESAFPSVPVRGAPALDLSSKKRSNIKVARAIGDSSRVGPQMMLHGHNRLDGMDVDLSVQIVRKGANGAYLVLHLVNPTTGRPDLCGEEMQLGRMHDVNIVASSHTRRSSVEMLRSGQTPLSLKALIKGSSDELVLHDKCPVNRPSKLSRDTRDVGGSKRINFGTMRFDVCDDNLLQQAAPDQCPLSPDQYGSLHSPQASGPSHQSRSRRGSAIAASNWVMTDGLTGFASQPRAPDGFGSSGLKPRTSAVLAGSHGDHDSSEEELGMLAHHSRRGGSDADDEGPADDDIPRASAAVGSGRYSNGGTDHKAPKHGDGSEGSELDEAQNVADDDADYRRGQRFKKLNRILNSEAITSKSKVFKWRTVCISAVLAAAGIAIYILCRMLIARQIESVDDLYKMGLASRKMMRCATMTLDMGMMYQPYPNLFLSPTLAGLSNTGADLKAMRALLTDSINIVAVNTRGAFVGFATPRRMPVAFGLRNLWETAVLDENFFVSLPSTEAKTDAYTTISPNATYTLKMFSRKISLFDGTNKMVAMARDLILNGPWYNATACTKFAHSVNWIDWTTSLYIRKNTGTVYLDGWLATLDGYAQVVISAASGLNFVQIAILIFQGLILSASAMLLMCYLGNQVDRHRHNVFSIFMVVPMAMVRTLAVQRISLDDADDSDSGLDDAGLRKGIGSGAGATTSGGQAETDGSRGAKGAANGGGGGGGGKGIHINIAGEFTSRTSPSRTAAQQSVWARLADTLAFWRRKKAAPSERRTLSRSLAGRLWLAWPFAVWGAVVIILNAVSYRKLQSVHGPVMTFNTANFFQCRLWRVLYAVQLLHFTNDTATSAASLREHLSAAQLEYQALLFGHKGVPQETLPHYTLISEGIADVAGAGQDLLFTSTHCMANTASGCLSKTDLYYPYTVHGYDMLVQHFFDVVQTVITELHMGISISNAGPEMQFLWKTRECLVGGSILLVSAYQEHVQMVYRGTQKLQTVTLIWTLILTVLYLVVILRPYLQEVSSERRRVVELLTQLPVDIDVENLVQRALIAGSLKGKQAAAAAGAAPAHATAAAAAATAAAQLAGFGSSRSLLPPGKMSSSLMPVAGVHSSILSLNGSGRVGKLAGKGGESGSSMEAPFLREGGSISAYTGKGV